MPVRNFYAVVTALIVSIACYLKAEQARFSGPVGDAISLIDQYYVDEVEERELVNAAMNGLVSKLDPYSQFIDIQSYGHFQNALQQRFAGIGIIVEQPDKNKHVRVVTPLLATPAFEAGLRPGDVIVEVDGTSTEGMKINEVSDMLRGPEGTDVSIGIRRGEKSISVTVRRAWIPLDSVFGDHRDQDNKWVFRLRDDPNIVYMRVTTFGEQTVSEVTKVFQELDNDFDSIILDLRQNQGGLLTAAVEIADMFLEAGMIVSTRGRGGKLESEFTASEGTLVDDEKPLVILLDGESASASEIVAACLKDHDRATIIGERSFGKGTVQNVLPLESGLSALKLTTARYYRPSGENIHRLEGLSDEDAWGVRPSEGMEVKLNDEQRTAAHRRLQRAAYPFLPELEDEHEPEQSLPTQQDPEESVASVDQDQDDVSSVEDQTNVEPGAIENDPQLTRAIEFLRDKQAGADTRRAA